MKNKILIYGRHPIKEVLEHRPEIIQYLYLNERHQNSELGKLATALAIPIFKTDEVKDQIPKDPVHQGALAYIDRSKLFRSDLDHPLIRNPETDTGLILLSNIEDPQNAGAIIRSAAALNISAVLIPSRHQAPVTGTVVKASAGLIFRLPLIEIGNINQTLINLKKAGYWIYGLDHQGDTDITEETFSKPTVLLIGNEGYGLKYQTLKLCDIKLRIPLQSDHLSLNASAAAAIAIFSWKNKQSPNL